MSVEIVNSKNTQRVWQRNGEVKEGEKQIEMQEVWQMEGTYMTWRNVLAA